MADRTASIELTEKEEIETFWALVDVIQAHDKKKEAWSAWWKLFLDLLNSGKIGTFETKGDDVFIEQVKTARDFKIPLGDKKDKAKADAVIKKLKDAAANGKATEGMIKELRKYVREK